MLIGSTGASIASEYVTKANDASWGFPPWEAWRMSKHQGGRKIDSVARSWEQGNFTPNRLGQRVGLSLARLGDAEATFRKGFACDMIHDDPMSKIRVSERPLKQHGKRKGLRSFSEAA
jgi:hypothetical protein